MFLLRSFGGERRRARSGEKSGNSRDNVFLPSDGLSKACDVLAIQDFRYLR
jgi:hypothetical protein